MADVVGAEYHERLLNLDDLIEFLPLMVYLRDEPIADPVCVPFIMFLNLRGRTVSRFKQEGILFCCLFLNAEARHTSHRPGQNVNKCLIMSEKIA